MATNNSINSAVSAKEKAEAKFEVQDYKGAVHCASVAKGLFPGLDGIDHMLAAYQVHLAAEKKDWRAVLGVGASENLGEIKKQYKRKAMLVHPDKNSSEDANDAFKFLMKAYEVLSMKNERSETAAPGSSSNRRSQPVSSASSSNRRSQPDSSSNCQAQPTSSSNRRSQLASSSNCRSERCPRCQKVCSFDTVYRSSITCTDCERRFFFRDGIFYYFECI